MKNGIFQHSRTDYEEALTIQLEGKNTSANVFNSVSSFDFYNHPF
jgi:hypothetical protein